MQLRFYNMAYEGKELVFRQCTFLKPKRHYISFQSQLRKTRFEQDASPQIERIEIGSCRLVLGINGIKHLVKLKEICLEYGSKVATLDMLQDEVNEHLNEPLLWLHMDRSDHDLGDPDCSDEYFDALESVPDLDGEGLDRTMPTASDRSVLHDSSSESLFFFLQELVTNWRWLRFTLLLLSSVKVWFSLGPRASVFLPDVPATLKSTAPWNG